MVYNLINSKQQKTAQFLTYSLGNSLFFKNSFTTNWITFFENYLHMMLKTEIFFFICYKLAKLDQITFHYTEMAGKVLNFNLASF